MPWMQNLPAGVVAKAAGRIDTLFAVEKQTVEKGEMLAYIENPALLQDVIKLKRYLSDFSMDSVRQQATTLQNLSAPITGLEVGDLQSVCNAFQKALNDYAWFLQAGYHNKKTEVIEKQMDTQKRMLQKTKNQLNLAKKQLESARNTFAMDSTLFLKNILAPAEFEAAKTAFFQSQQACENVNMSMDNQQISIFQSEQSLVDLQQQRIEQETTLQLALTLAYDQLSTQLKTWEQTYLLVAPTAGKVSFTTYWQKNQNIHVGEVLVTIVPAEKTSIIGKIHLPPQGAGKVKAGQDVNVKLDNFPYMEYGMIRVKINRISLVPIDDGNGKKAYILEVEFPETLTTNYGKALVFSQEMTGTAEIITEDLRLIDRFIQPLKAVIKK